MDDDKAIQGSLYDYEAIIERRGGAYEPDPLMEIVERNLEIGFASEKPTVIDEISEQFEDVLGLAQWAGFVDDDASLDSLADAFDAYTKSPGGAEGWPSPMESANDWLILVAGLIRRARRRLEPKPVTLSDGREVSIVIGFNDSAVSAALYLVVAKSTISGAIAARQHSVRAAADARRAAGEPTREAVFNQRDEILARDPSAKKEAQAWEISMKLGLSFEHVRKMLRTPKGDGRIDDTPRRNDDAL